MNKGLPIPLVIKLSRQLLEGVSHIHSKAWIHRDLKPGNLMLNLNWHKSLLGFNTNINDDFDPLTKQFRKSISNIQLTIGDFGLSKTIDYPRVPMTKEIMTLWYRAPEVILDNLCYD